MKILAIETSAVTCSVAFSDGERITEELVNNGLNHSKTLMPLIDTVLKKAEASVKDVDLFACSSGPGSFTGIRIGVSAVKGLASAEDKPCAGISTLEVIARSHGEDALICCVMDARRNQFYNALFEKKDGVLTRLTEDNADSGESIAERLKEIDRPFVIMGDGARVFEKFADGLSYTLPANEGIYQRATGVISAITENAYTPLKAGLLLPVYLRVSQAEREYAQKHGKEE